MPYIALIQTADGVEIRPVAGTDITTAEATVATQIGRLLTTGLARGADGNQDLSGAQQAIADSIPSVRGTDATLIGIIQLDGFGRVIPGATPAAPVAWTNATQAAIADLPALTVSNITQANTAIQTIRTTVNTMLAELRAAGIIAP
jgi:hypothetical protein